MIGSDWMARCSPLGSISPMFYVQFLRAQIPKAHKNTVKLSVFFALSESARIKAAHKRLMKLIPDLVDGFANVFTLLIIGHVVNQ